MELDDNQNDILNRVEEFGRELEAYIDSTAV
jgi:hypothetical protein